jgi:hypothetical protein
LELGAAWLFTPDLSNSKFKFYHWGRNFKKLYYSFFMLFYFYLEIVKTILAYKIVFLRFHHLTKNKKTMHFYMLKIPCTLLTYTKPEVLIILYNKIFYVWFLWYNIDHQSPPKRKPSFVTFCFKFNSSSNFLKLAYKLLKNWPRYYTVLCSARNSLYKLLHNKVIECLFFIG